MPRLPAYGHRLAGTAPAGSSMFRWMPGYRGAGAMPIQRVPVHAYTKKIQGVPLTGGQAQGVISGGTLTLQVGPQGIGNIWYPASVVVSTTTGVLDTSTALAYLGPAAIPITLQGSVFSGNGTVALAIPSMAPGQTIIVRWTGAHNGDLAAMNVTGTMDALSTA